jgi:feruloyl esterase
MLRRRSFPIATILMTVCAMTGFAKGAGPAIAPSGLAGLKIPASAISLPTTGAEVTSAVLVQATDKGNQLGEYCKVLATIHPVDPKAPDILLRANLPTRWNGKALQMGGGGYNGNIPNTLIEPTLGLKTLPVPLAQGYITFADDSGHQAPDSNDASFALNDEALANYGYMHIKKARDAVFAIAKAYYGVEPRKLYFSGGSTGGREGLTAAMRWPESYDGILANYPTANFLGLRLWGAILARAIYDKGSEGWIPPAMVDRIAKTAIQRFDILDGVADGLVSNNAQARAQSGALLSDLSLRPGDPVDIQKGLTKTQIEKTLDVYHNGFKLPYSLANGVDSYAGYNSLEGITMQIGSQAAYIEPPVSGPNAHHVSRADQFFKYFIARDPNFSLLSFDIMNPGALKDRIVLVSEITGATDPDFEKMQARGGKVLWVQGMDDPSVSPFENINIYKSIVARLGQEKVDSFMRLYLVPGLAHGGGNFSVTWDNLAILDNWVENDIPPPVTPGVDINKATFGRSRPMCEYPAWPKYNGSGDVNDWKSYSIVKP